MQSVLSRLKSVRQQSLDMLSPLEQGDFRIQSMPEVSPPWWNIGHTSWFFAKNILEPAGLGHDTDRAFEFVLNSYYNCHGPRVAQADRGKLSRPTTDQIFAYRRSVDERLFNLFASDSEAIAKWRDTLITGIHHEEQHQELFYTEIKHIFGSNPKKLRPSYRTRTPQNDQAKGTLTSAATKTAWHSFSQATFYLGADLDSDWSWDNECGGGETIVAPFEMSTSPATCGDFLEFIEAGGYHQPNYWLDNGWREIQKHSWEAPLYWDKNPEGNWQIFTLAGPMNLRLDEPVCHLSFYEADAYARWRGCRLPSEVEWEYVARQSWQPDQGQFIENGKLHPDVVGDHGELCLGLAGCVWEWTSSNYRAYPSYTPFLGALSEYNGKFMDGQYVLRGGSVLTSRPHIRCTYRNFWHPATRFQMSGVRLARSQS